jgi:hypothetical protein
MKILPLEFWTEFRTPSGEVRELKNPESACEPETASKAERGGSARRRRGRQCAAAPSR